MKVLNQTKNTIIAFECKTADNFFTRLKGLIGKKLLPEGSGLLIIPCNSIHMFFMKIPLDVIFIDKAGKVVYLSENIKPWQATRIIKKARCTIELPAGTIAQSRTEVGDKLEFSEK